MNIICLSRTPDAFHALQTYAINLIMVESIAALMDTLTHTKCSGIILDVKCLMRTNAHYKRLLYEFIDAFPTLRVNSTCNGYGFIPLDDPDKFITHTCANFQERSVRANRRMRVVLPLLLARDAAMQDAVKTCSIDLSENGMFIFSTDQWRIDAQAWIQLMDIRDHAPIRTTVRWVQPWGTGLRFPGIGTTFEQITPKQHEELCRKFLLRQSNRQDSFVSELASLTEFIETEWSDNCSSTTTNNEQDHPVAQKETGMKSITVKGMHCPKCQSAVTEAMSKLDGIADVDVNLENGLVTFSEEKPVAPETIKQAIENIGFEVA